MHCHTGIQCILLIWKFFEEANFCSDFNYQSSPTHATPAELQWKPEHLMSFVFFSIFQGVGPWDAGSQFECSLSETISVGDLISTFGLYEINKRIS